MPFVTVYLADFLVWVLQRHHPVLRSQTLLVQSEGRIVACSATLRQQGVRPGWSTERAQTMAPEALVRPQPGGSLQQVYWEEVLWHINQCTPWVESSRPGLALASLEEPSVLGRLARSLDAQVGVASTRSTSLLAALPTPPGRVRRLLPGQEEVYRRRLSIDYLTALDVDEDLLQRLVWLGFPTVGSLARLTRLQLATRFGEVGHWLFYLSQGQGDTPVAAFIPPPTVVVSRSFEPVLQDPGEVVPVLGVMVEQAAAALQNRLAQSVTVQMTDHLPRRRLLRTATARAEQLLVSARLCWDDVCRPVRHRIGVEIDRVTVTLGGLVPCPVRQGCLWEARPQVEKAVAEVEARLPGSLFRMGLSPVPTVPEESWHRVNPLAPAYQSWLKR